MRLRVTKFGESVLRKAGEKVEAFDNSLRTLAADMVETMFEEEGVGLAAQQVDQAIRLCVVDVSHLPDEELDYELDGQRKPINLIMPMALVNPEVTALPGKKTKGDEGCLSFPGIRGDVVRPDRIEVDFQDLNGNRHMLLCSGWFARVIQHEVDHLNGILFIDRMDQKQLRQIEAQVKRLKKETQKELLSK